MGTFHTPIEVAREAGGPYETVEALVDSGATYTLLPRTLLERLGVQRRSKRTFVIADGTVHELDMGLIWIRLQGEENPSLVVFGPDDAEPLLGAVTMEEFALGIDPVRRELTRVRGYLVGLRQEDGDR
jgi:predicted aspartyl protease